MHIKHYYEILEFDLRVEQFTDFLGQKLINASLLEKYHASYCSC